MGLIDREAAIAGIDPDRILPDWIRGYVTSALKDVPEVQLPAPLPRRRAKRDPAAPEEIMKGRD